MNLTNKTTDGAFVKTMARHHPALVNLFVGQGRARHSARAVSESNQARRARSDAPYHKTSLQSAVRSLFAAAIVCTFLLPLLGRAQETNTASTNLETSASSL